MHCYQLDLVVVRKSDWSIFNIRDGTFVQSHFRVSPYDGICVIFYIRQKKSVYLSVFKKRKCRSAPEP